MIIPAILEENLSEINRKISLVEGLTDKIQIDVCDGVFVEEETFLDISKINTKAKIEFHLMVANPMQFVDIPLKESDSVIIHVESKNAEQAINQMLKKTKNVGICKNPETPVSELEKYVNLVNYVQFLTVNPGKQGQTLIEKPIEEASQFKKKYPMLSIQIDGGVNEYNMKSIIDAKINNLAVGSAIFSDSNPTKKLKFFIQKLQRLNKKIKVAFLGGSAWYPQEETFKDAYEVAKLLAEKGYIVVNGGGPGVMRAATLGAQAAGKYVQTITYHPGKTKIHYEGNDLENTSDDEVITLDYFDRTKVMLQTTDVHIVFKGSIGTLSEFGMTWVSSWIHEPDSKPIILYGEFWNEILQVLTKNLHIVNHETDLFKVISTPQEVVEYLDKLGFTDKNNGNSLLH